MNILLTGEPHSGKSTLMRDVLSGIEAKQGFLTQELMRNDRRTGFELISSLGDRALLASTDVPGTPRVSRYGVNVSNLEQFLARLPSTTENDLLYIDEIGQMQLFSPLFRQHVLDCLDARNPFIGTLTSVYHDSFTDALRIRDDVEIIELSTETRDIVRDDIAERIAEHVSN